MGKTDSLCPSGWWVPVVSLPAAELRLGPLRSSRPVPNPSHGHLPAATNLPDSNFMSLLYILDDVALSCWVSCAWSLRQLIVNVLFRNNGEFESLYLPVRCINLRCHDSDSSLVHFKDNHRIRAAALQCRSERRAGFGKGRQIKNVSSQLKKQKRERFNDS